MTCQELAQLLLNAQGKLSADQQALSFANQQLNIDLASATNQDPNHPVPIDWLTVPPYINHLYTLMPPPQGLIALYQKIMGDFTTIGGLSVTISDDQATITKIKQQQKQQGCT